MQPARLRKHRQSTGRRRPNLPATWITCPVASQMMTMQVGNVQHIHAHLRHVTYTHFGKVYCGLQTWEGLKGIWAPLMRWGSRTPP